ncbi:alpha/beta hydrolase [Paenibacillus hexagrammi]|uniref:Alpha/beta fold hydrolase n=1 Tax=Paenibacillus hexagrammi TaxID=2908839 RepID=A0ABY3SGE7_9BACL|nr:alpha/beta fold hydrolase [Paenibacillus sp. YPD9-1]UJF33052.1 alpha/beta fold hydrolase [Paenibacillus sp. YPD9-1]
MGENRVYRSTEPFSFKGLGSKSQIALLMVHGFTGSPSEFRRVGYFLHDQGYTVQAVRLPGHGTSPEEMRRTEWTDWYGHVRDQYDELAAVCKNIVVIGHSMGGLLTFMLAAERRPAGIISLAAPIYLATRHASWAVLLQYMLHYVEKKSKNIPTLLNESCAYTKTPIRSVVSLLRLIKRVRKLLPKIAAPVWIGQGNQDAVVRHHSAEFLYQKVGSSVKELHYYPRSSHGMLLDLEREQIYEDITSFIESLQFEQ